MISCRARRVQIERALRRESIRNEARRAILTLDGTTSYTTWLGKRVYLSAAFAAVIARPVEVEAPRVGPEADARPADVFPSRLVRVLGAYLDRAPPVWARAGGSLAVPP